MISVSLASKKDLATVLVVDNGYEKLRKTHRTNTQGIQFLGLLEALKTAILYLKSYIEETGSEDAVIFECKSVTLVKWFKQGYSVKNCEEYFNEVLKMLDDLPTRYSFRVNETPYANVYLSESYLEKPIITNTDFMEGIEDA